MAITALQLLAVVKADTKQAEGGLSGLAGMAKALAGPLVLGGVVAAAAGVGIASIKMAGDFQEGMTSLVTGAGESSKNIKLVSDGILNLATQTGTSTQQLTAGMYMIESAGYHGKAGLDVLTAAAEGAKVGNADLGTVADATTTLLTDFGKQAGGASGAVNLLVGTVASGKTHMQDLALSLSQIAPTAAAAHVGITDMMGAMATMTGEGVPAANAATYLRQTIIALDAPSKQTVTALKSVGLSSSAVAAEMQKSLPDALKMITDAVGKKFPVGSAQYVAALKDISGGSKQMQGILDLTGSHMGTFAGNVSNLAGTVKKGGSSIVGWGEVQKDFNFKVDKAREVVETLMIRLGTGLLPIAGKLADFLSANLIPAVNAVAGFIGGVVKAGQGLIHFFQDAGPASTAVKVAIAILGGAMLGFAASAIPALVTSLIASVTAFGAQALAAGAAAIATIAAAAPFILVGAAIGAVVAIVILAVTHWKQITTALGHFKDMILSAPAPIKVLAAILLLPLAPIIAIVAGIVLLVTHWKQVIAVLGQVAGAVGTFVGHVLGAIGAFIGNVIGAVKDFAGKLLSWYLWPYQQAWDFLQSILPKIGAFLHNAWDTIVKDVTAVVSAIFTYVKWVFTSDLAFIQSVMGAIGSFLHTAWNTIVGDVKGVVGGFIGIFQAIGNGIDSAIRGGLNLVIGDINAFIRFLDGIKINIPAIGVGPVHTPAFSWNGLGIPTIPMLAEGGVITSPGQVIVGDAGPEMLQLPAGAVVQPLPAGLRSPLGTASQGGMLLPVIINMDGKRITQLVTQLQPAVIRNATGARST